MSERKTRKKMSARRFRAIMIPIICFAIIFAVAGTLAANYFAVSLDNYLGRGKIVYDTSASYTSEDTRYYDQAFERSLEGKTQASYAGAELAERISDEGEVLLKNNGVLPLEKNEKVTPFGYRFADPVMTGTGSGAATLLQPFVVRPADALASYFSVNQTIADKIKSGKPVFATAQGYKNAADKNGAFAGATASVAELDPSIYTMSDIGDYKTALVFIGRQGGEGNDLQMTPYFDDKGKQIASHQLQLMPYERQMLLIAKLSCEKLIVIVNSPNPMELRELEQDEAVDAILWVGTTGCRGFESMAKILCGEVNPSGRLVDTYAADFTADPTFHNFGEHYYDGFQANMVTEYEEGIYVGYKYYETRWMGDEEGYRNAVVYPFGYGLHYDNESISQTLTDVSVADQTVTVKGTIVNDSSREVKEVVQLYADPPYHAESGIEKAAKNLVAFEKVAVPANQSREFTITFPLEDLASYDARGYYTEGKGSYVLESGDYGIYLGKNAHESWADGKVQVERTVVYFPAESLASAMAECEYAGKRQSDLVTATNQYRFMTDYMDGTGDFGASGACDTLKRADGLAGMPASPDGKKMPEAVLQQVLASDMGAIDYSEHITAKYGKDAPKTGADNHLQLSELRGLAYDDPKWDLLLDQLDYSPEGIREINKLLGNGSFNTSPISAIGKGTTSESDGPQAIGKTGVSDGTGAACAYPAEVVIASTWNVDLAEAMGESIGQEALAQGSNGWYAPACNIHRSPFMGRVYEYYSEDGVLSGAIAAATVQGASSRGYTPYMKHFAVNEQDHGRGMLITWVDEQALREIYLKPFEMAVKNAKITEYYLARTDDGGFVPASRTMKAATGIMTSMNRLGGTYTGLDYALCTAILRNEWGFEGAVITDSYTAVHNQMDVSIAAGNDFYLTFMSTELNDTDSAAARWSIRQAIHNICYATVNSNAMQNVGPGLSYHYATSPWVYGIIGIDAVCALIAACGIWLILRKNRKTASDRQVA